MITINVCPFHPVTLVTADERRYHFARLIGTSGPLIIVELRGHVPSAALEMTHLVIELFGFVGTVRVGTVSIQLACRNMSMSRTRFLQVQPIDAAALKIRIRHFPPDK